MNTTLSVQKGRLLRPSCYLLTGLDLSKTHDIVRGERIEPAMVQDRIYTFHIEGAPGTLYESVGGRGRGYFMLKPDGTLTQLTRQQVWYALCPPQLFGEIRSLLHRTREENADMRASLDRAYLMCRWIEHDAQRQEVYQYLLAYEQKMVPQDLSTTLNPLEGVALDVVQAQCIRFRWLGCYLEMLTREEYSESITQQVYDELVMHLQTIKDARVFLELQEESVSCKYALPSALRPALWQAQDKSIQNRLEHEMQRIDAEQRLLMHFGLGPLQGTAQEVAQAQTARSRIAWSYHNLLDFNSPWAEGISHAVRSQVCEELLAHLRTVEDARVFLEPDHASISYVCVLPPVLRPSSWREGEVMIFDRLLRDEQSS